jgi:hypothetical protein
MAAGSSPIADQVIDLAKEHARHGWKMDLSELSMCGLWNGDSGLRSSSLASGVFKCLHHGGRCLALR